VSWVTPPSRLVGDPITVSDFNQSVRDNTNYLYGDAAWQTVGTFTNGWGAGTPPPQYRRDGSIVTVRGVLTGGTNTTYGFALPTAYRPSSNLLLPCVGSNLTEFAFVGVDSPTGQIAVHILATAVGVYLDTVVFDCRA
jgi:hypothetical protein